MLSFSATSAELDAVPGLAFDLPVVVTRAETAVDMLGGHDVLERELYEGTKTAPSLRLRADPGHHPVPGTREPCFMLCLRIQRVAADKTGKAGAASGAVSAAGSTAGRCEVSLLRAAREVIRFRHLAADMQYLPLGQPMGVNAALISRYMLAMSTSEHEAGGDVFSRYAWMRHLDEHAMRVPRAFVSLAKPMTHVMAIGDERKEAAPAKSNTLVHEITQQTFNLATDAAVPIEPLATPFELPGIPASQLVTLVDRLKRLFEARPVWTLSALFVALRKDDEEHVKVYSYLQIHQYFRRLLCVVAYYVPKGPFRRTWIRLGYDPRDNSASAIYQIVECELKFEPILRDLHRLGIGEDDGPEERRTNEWHVFIAGAIISGRVAIQLVDLFANERVRGSMGIRIKSKADVVAETLAVDYNGTMKVDAVAFGGMLNSVVLAGTYNAKTGWLPTTNATKLRDRCTKLLQVMQDLLSVRPVSAEVRSRVLVTWKREDFGSRKRAKRDATGGGGDKPKASKSTKSYVNPTVQALGTATLQAMSGSVLMKAFANMGMPVVALPAPAASADSLTALLLQSPALEEPAPEPVQEEEVELTAEL